MFGNLALARAKADKMSHAQCALQIVSQRKLSMLIILTLTI